MSHTICFHLYDPWLKAKLQGQRIDWCLSGSGYVGEQNDCKGAGGDRNVLHLDCGSRSMTYPSVKTHHAVHLKSVNFTVCKLHFDKLHFKKEKSWWFMGVFSL